MALVLLVLGAGLPLLDEALGDGDRPVPRGTVLSVGARRDGVRPVSFEVTSAGWKLDEERSALGSGAELTRDEVVFDVSVVVPLTPLNARALWDGLARIVSVRGTARLRAGPSTITAVDGLRGLTGRLAGDGRAGSATVFARDTLGATVTVWGPPAAFRRAAAQVEAMARTIRIAP